MTNPNDEKAMCQIVREVCKGTDEELSAFLGGYAIGAIAEHLIKIMPEENRVAFFKAMQTAHPEYFK